MAPLPQMPLRAARRLSALAAAALLAGCSSDITSPDLVVDPIDVDRVEVLVSAGTLTRVSAHVEGRVGDGCTRVLPIEQSRNGTVIALRINRSRPVVAVCTQQLLLFDEVIPLQGEFPPGAYRLTVNARDVTFQVP